MKLLGLTVIASAAKQSILDSLRHGLLRWRSQ